MTEADIQRSIDYYHDLSEADKTLINHYKAEMDPDDWEDNPLKISYIVINWLLKKKEKEPVTYVPELIESGVISKEELSQQVENAEHLYNILESFPTVTDKNGIMVYRGKTCGNIINKKIGTPITMSNFLSTSTSFAVGARFAAREKPCIMRIRIPTGTPLPYISETLDPTTSEAEVLLPPGSTFKLIGKTMEGIYNIYDFDLVRFGRIKTRNFWPEYQSLARTIPLKRKNSSSSSRSAKRNNKSSGGGKKRTQKKKRKYKKKQTKKKY
jgi:hypothetical protein